MKNTQKNKKLMDCSTNRYEYLKYSKEVEIAWQKYHPMVIR